MKSQPAFPPNQLPNKVMSLSVFSLGFTVAEPSYNHSQFSTVQQLQDSSTLESQALSSSYHPPNLLHVSTAEVVSMSSFSCQLLTFRCCRILFQMFIYMHYRPQIQRKCSYSVVYHSTGTRKKLVLQSVCSELI